MRNGSRNIMHVTFSLDIGGSEKLVLELVNRVNKDLFKSSVCCLTKHGNLSKELDDFGVKADYLNKKDGIDYLLPFKLAKILKKEKIDIIHTHDSTANLYAIAAVKIAGRGKIFNTEHGGIYFESNGKKIINRLLCHLNKKMVCVSNSIRDDLVKMGLPKNRLKVIPNGIDLEKFNISIDLDKKRAELGLNDSDFIICSVGRLSKEKNQKMLLDSVKPILSEIPNAKFLIVGDGPMKRQLEDYAVELKISPATRFLGMRTDVPEILQISHCFISCSDFESFGLSIVEAMIAGIPVIATDAGGVKEIITNNITGVLIPKNSRQSLFEATLKIRNDVEFSKSLISKAKDFAKSFYSIDRMIEAYESLYIK